MARTRRTGNGIWWIVVALGTLVPMTAQAAPAADDTGWRLRVDFAVVDPGGSPGRVDIGTGVVETDFDVFGGIGIRGEYQFNRRVGIDFGLLAAAGVDVTARAGGTTTVAAVDVSTFSPFTVGANFHLTPGARVDVYVGPQLAWVTYSDVEVIAQTGGSGTSVSVDRDVGLAAVLGLDVPVGASGDWAFQTNLRYIDTSMTNDGTASQLDVAFDPVIFSLGFARRW